MKKLMLVAGLAVCLCGCGKADVVSENAMQVTEAAVRVEATEGVVVFSKDSAVKSISAPSSKVFSTPKTEVTTQAVTKVTTEQQVKSTEKTIVETKTETKKPEPVTKKQSKSKTQMKKKKDIGNVATEKSTKDSEELTMVKDEQQTSEEQKIVAELEEEAKKEEEEKSKKTAFGYTLQYSAVYNVTEGHLTKSNGSIRYNGHRETWYSTNEGAGKYTAVSIPGKHVADDGTIRDADGYICVASSDYRFYTTLMTSVGPAKVYDCGCSHGTIDVYTCW